MKEKKQCPLLENEKCEVPVYGNPKNCPGQCQLLNDQTSSERRRIFQLTTALKKMGQYELAHFLTGQLAAGHFCYAPDNTELTVLTDANLGHELLEIRDVETRMAEVIAMADVDPTWLYYHMAYGHVKSGDRKGRSWGVTGIEKIDREELKKVLNSLWPRGINSLSPVDMPAFPGIEKYDTCHEMVDKCVDYFLDRD